jgi:haloalkane dehalogenase
MNWVTPPVEQLQYLRPDPLLWEQELDVRPDVAEAVEHAVGFRAGRRHWQSRHDHLYAIELADLGRGRPSMAMIYGFWDRFEPRPPEHEINADLMDFLLWMASTTESLRPEDFAKVAQFAGVRTSWGPGEVLRTPEERFANLPDFAYEPQYIEIEGLRLAYIEHGAGDPILCLHGEPTWSFLYRHMIPVLAQKGRVIAPDLIGFGRSDKPVAANAYSYKAHVRWVRTFVERLGLERTTMVCQDWGGMLGLRMLSQIPERFRKVFAMNTGIAAGQASPAFLQWRAFSQRVPELELGTLMQRSMATKKLSDAEKDAYRAPFPAKEYQTAALVFPRLVPTRRDHPGAYDNAMAIERLRALDIPVQLIWGAHDAITAPAVEHLRSIFRNCPEARFVSTAGHFIQEEAGAEVAQLIVKDF